MSIEATKQLATRYHWFVGVGIRPDGTLDRYGIKDGELQLIGSIPPTDNPEARAVQMDKMFSDRHPKGTAA